MASYDATYFEGADDEFIEDQDVDKPKRKSAKGRKLVRWSPDLDQLVLICTDYICAQQGVAIPWDEVAKEVEPFLSGEAIKQHLAKVRKFREQAGMKVPPLVDRNQRRRTIQGAGTNHSRHINIKEEDEEPKQPGSSLLYKPGNKKFKTPKNKTSQKTPTAASRSHKYQPSINASQAEMDKFFHYDTDYGAPKRKSTAVGARARARSTRSRMAQNEEGALKEISSPSKRPKIDTYLRPQKIPNYAAQMVQDDEEDEEEEEEGEDKTNVGGAKDDEFDGNSKSCSSKKQSVLISNDRVYDQPPPTVKFQSGLPYNGHSKFNNSGLSSTTGLNTTNIPSQGVQQDIFGTYGTNPTPMMTWVMEKANPCLHNSNPISINHGYKEYNNGNMDGGFDNFAYYSAPLPNTSFTPILVSDVDSGIIGKKDEKLNVDTHSFHWPQSGKHQFATISLSPRLLAEGETGIHSESSDLQSAFDPVQPSQNSSFDSTYNGSLILDDDSNNMITHIGLNEHLNHGFHPIDGFPLTGDQYFGF